MKTSLDEEDMVEMMQFAYNYGADYAIEMSTNAMVDIEQFKEICSDDNNEDKSKTDEENSKP